MLLLVGMLGTLYSLFTGEALGDPDSFMGKLMLFLAGFCVTMVFLLIAIIMFLIGLIYLVSGKTEFGGPHDQAVVKGLILVILGFVLGIVGDCFGMIVGSIISVVTTAMTAFGLYFLICEIANEYSKGLLRMATILIIALSTGIAILTIWLSTTNAFFSEDYIRQADPDAMLINMFGIMMIFMAIGSLNLIPIFMFFVAYKNTYNRLKSGELIPPYPIYTYPFPPPPPPGYPPQPGYPPYPGYPPPPGYPHTPPDQHKGEKSKSGGDRKPQDGGSKSTRSDIKKK